MSKQSPPPSPALPHGKGPRDNQPGEARHTKRAPMSLNNMAHFARWVVAGEAAAVGVILGGILLDRTQAGSASTALNCWLVGLGLLVVVNMLSLAILTRSNARQVARTEAALGELLDSAVAPGLPVPARVEYLRGGKISGGAIQPPPAGVGLDEVGEVVAAVLTVLPETGPARRAMALLALPHDRINDVLPRGSLHLALLHPTDLETCVIDYDASDAELDQAAADPRWLAGPLPTNSTLVGGYRALAAVVAGAIACGVALAALVGLLS